MAATCKLLAQYWFSGIRTSVNLLIHQHRNHAQPIQHRGGRVPVGILVRRGNSTRTTPPSAPPDSWCCHTCHSPVSWAPVFEADTPERTRALSTLLGGRGRPSSPLSGPVSSDTHPPPPCGLDSKGLSPIRRPVLSLQPRCLSY